MRSVVGHGRVRAQRFRAIQLARGAEPPVPVQPVPVPNRTLPPCLAQMLSIFTPRAISTPPPRISSREPTFWGMRRARARPR